jgi:hypothetical protein
MLQSPMNIFPDLVRLVLELHTLKKCLHLCEDIACNVTDWPMTCWKSITFDDKAKVGALVQRVRTFKKQKLAEEAEEDTRKEQKVLASAVSTRQYAIVWKAGSVTGRARTM